MKNLSEVAVKKVIVIYAAIFSFLFFSQVALSHCYCGCGVCTSCTGTLNIYVRDCSTNSPISDARLDIRGTSINPTEYTDSNGFATFTLEDGTYLLDISKDGYKFTRTNVVVTSGETNCIDICIQETYQSSCQSVCPCEGACSCQGSCDCNFHARNFYIRSCSEITTTVQEPTHSLVYPIAVKPEVVRQVNVSGEVVVTSYTSSEVSTSYFVYFGLGVLTILLLAGIAFVLYKISPIVNLRKGKPELYRLCEKQ